MDQQSSSNDKDKLPSPVHSSTQRLSLQFTDRRDSTVSSSRTLAPVAFFRDGVPTNNLGLQNHIMGAERRARAIATAPRRKRHDDDKDEEDTESNKSSLFGFIKTSALSIPIPAESQRHHSLPQTQSDMSRLPIFRVDSPPEDKGEGTDYTYNENLRRNRYSSPS